MPDRPRRDAPTMPMPEATAIARRTGRRSTCSAGSVCVRRAGGGVVAAVTATLVAAPAPASPACRDYECVAIIESDAPCFTTFASVLPSAIAGDMTVVGMIECIDAPRPFRWTPENGLEVIDVPGTSEGELEDINENGVAVGWARMADDGGLVGLIVGESGVFETVEPPAGWGNLWFSAINESGDIAGVVSPPVSSAFSPVLYDSATASFEVFRNPPDTVRWSVFGVTEDRAILGSVQRASPSALDGALLRDGVVDFLETSPDAPFTVVQGMSSDGIVSGYGLPTPISPPVPLAWNEEGALIPIQGDPNGRSASVLGVAPDGWRVGGWLREGNDIITATWRLDGRIFAIEPDDRACDFGDRDEAVDMAAGGLLVAEAVHAETLAAVAVIMRAVESDTAPADFDCDGQVGFSDLLYVLWAAQTPTEHYADLSGDGTVDLDDVLLVLESWD